MYTHDLPATVAKQLQWTATREGTLGKPRDVVKIDATPRLDIAFDDLHHAQTR